VSAGASHAGRPRLIGAHVTRKVDDRLLRGGGRYVADLELPRMVHAHVLRSTAAHARVTGVNADDGLGLPGVFALIQRADLQGTKLPCVQVQPGQLQEEYEIIPEVARYVGQPLGLVVAESRARAEDAAEMIWFDLDELAPLVEIADALHDDNVLYPELGTNLLVDFTLGDPSEEVRTAIDEAAHVATMSTTMHRHHGSPMETRGVVAEWDVRRELLTLHSSTQVAHHARDHLAGALGLRADQVRVIVPDVGGGFGVKDHLYPDEVLVAFAAMRLRRPVKWIEDRVEHLIGTVAARDHRAEATLAVDADGRFLAWSYDIVTNIGGHASNVGAGPAAVSAAWSEGPYRFAKGMARIRGVVTNLTPVGAYRGYGMPESTFVRERLIDEVCRLGGFDSEEIRRLNLVTAEEMPYLNRLHGRLDSGDYPRAFNRALELLPEPERDQGDGKLRVRVAVPYAEMTAVGPTQWMQRVGFRQGGYETSIVEVAPDGSVTVRTGVCSQGQGHETVFAQIVADRLGVGMDDVRVIQGDTQEVPYSDMGTIASRGLTLAGGAAMRASEAVGERLKAVAAHQLEANPADMELVDGRAQVRGAPSAFRTVADLAKSVWLGWDLPEEVEPGALIERCLFDPPEQTISYATHGYQLAVDPELGSVEVEKVVVVHDCGVVVNPMLVEGQTHGGLAQGIGEALLESMHYDASGQPLSITFKDYLLPLSETIPDMVYEHFETPAPHIPGGFKGTGEGGTITGPAAIASGLARLFPDASPYLCSTDLSPRRVWEALGKAASD
jgi:carbon-monoxide dehydrogenase large subunit